ncbi:hypothetical protein LT679_00140 [Mucilaginibacter roseus]|uniref:Uncharacterized protein n=1 Tax=Mucilaginibacter roseus TaxID=1528868 RepID=A0ABS8TVT8_9SPHI|nr:hypothetical protein [Mucilaginibacter roseus]MCD8738994.1 hypothetical protein [Mucilaginibacter roseus]
MKLGEEILKVLNKIYEPDTMVEKRFKRYDIAFKTDGYGRPILLFFGEKDERGHIKGERFARRLITAPDGTVIKDHWENKGRST